MAHPADVVIADYTNHKGERRERPILPQSIYFGATRYHPEAQWLLRCHDVERHVDRTFAMKNVHSWRSANASSDVEVVRKD